MMFPNHVHGEARVALGRKWGRASGRARAAERIVNGPDWDTIRKHGADDLRGAVLREGCLYSALGAEPWEITRSRDGRRNQCDLVLGGVVLFTGAKREI